tara:strand:- start:7534 stop:7746 length:213 start_codon:yes stop_codon:yes gene_type:complete
MTDSEKLLINLKDVIELAKKHIGEFQECEDNPLQCIIEEYDYHINNEIDLNDDDMLVCDNCFVVFKKMFK